MNNARPSHRLQATPPGPDAAILAITTTYSCRRAAETTLAKTSIIEALNET